PYPFLSSFPLPLPSPPPTGGEGRVASSLWSNLLGHYLKAAERVRAKGRADRDIRRVATAGDQHPPDAREVVACVKRVPPAAEIGFEPGGEIHCRVGDGHPDVPQIAGAVPRRDVHAAAERDREVSVVPADASAIAVSFPRRPGGAGVFI